MKCDCNGCDVCTGEAAYRVTRRDGSEANLCTRCDLSSDTYIGRLFDEADVPRLVELDVNKRNDEWGVLLDMFGGIGVLLRDQLTTMPRVGE